MLLIIYIILTTLAGVGGTTENVDGRLLKESRLSGLSSANRAKL